MPSGGEHSHRLSADEMFAAVMRHCDLECTKVEGGPYPVDVEGALSTMTAEPRWTQYPTMQMIHGSDGGRWPRR